MKGCICHFTKWQIHLFMSTGTILCGHMHSDIDIEYSLVSFQQTRNQKYIQPENSRNLSHFALVIRLSMTAAACDDTIMTAACEVVMSDVHGIYTAVSGVKQQSRKRDKLVIVSGLIQRTCYAGWQSNFMKCGYVMGAYFSSLLRKHEKVSSFIIILLQGRSMRRGGGGGELHFQDKLVQ